MQRTALRAAAAALVREYGRPQPRGKAIRRLKGIQDVQRKERISDSGSVDEA